MDLHRIAVYVILSVALLRDTPERPAMYYTDTSHGRSFAKDPDVA